MALLVKLGLVTASQAAALDDKQVNALVDHVQFELVQQAITDHRLQSNLKEQLAPSVKSVVEPSREATHDR